MEWLASGMRRDICVLLYGEAVRRQKLKSRLQRRYDRQIRPGQFSGALEAMERSGHVEKRVDGIHDVYALTDAGAEHVKAQYEWLRERVEDSEETDVEGTSGETDSEETDSEGAGGEG